jgi:hypothetical protein
VNSIDADCGLGDCFILSMLESGRPRTGTSSRVAATIASLLAVVLTLVFVLRTTSNGELLRLPADRGPVGASVESGDFESLPFGKLLEESVGEDASEKTESKDLEATALSSVEIDALAQVGCRVGEWERAPVELGRVLLCVTGARGPPGLLSPPRPV